MPWIYQIVQSNPLLLTCNPHHIPKLLLRVQTRSVTMSLCFIRSPKAASTTTSGKPSCPAGTQISSSQRTTSKVPSLRWAWTLLSCTGRSRTRHTWQRTGGSGSICQRTACWRTSTALFWAKGLRCSRSSTKGKVSIAKLTLCFRFSDMNRMNQ